MCSRIKGVLTNRTIRKRIFLMRLRQDNKITANAYNKRLKNI
jgi:hypothetical protein